MSQDRLNSPETARRVLAPTFPFKPCMKVPKADRQAADFGVAWFGGSCYFMHAAYACAFCTAAASPVSMWGSSYAHASDLPNYKCSQCSLFLLSFRSSQAFIIGLRTTKFNFLISRLLTLLLSFKASAIAPTIIHIRPSHHAAHACYPVCLPRPYTRCSNGPLKLYVFHRHCLATLPSTRLTLSTDVSARGDLEPVMTDALGAIIPFETSGVITDEK